MRYKQDVAKFLSIADAARLVQERAGISENEAREDLVSAIQDGAVQYLVSDVRKDGRHLRMHGYDDIIRQLSSERIDWSQSLVRGGSVYVPYTVEIEVLRSGLDLLWPNSAAAASNLTDASSGETRHQLDTRDRVKGGRKSRYDSGLQEFIDDVREQLVNQDKRLTLGTLDVWLQNNAPPEKPYESGIDDCDDVYFEGGKISWTDSSGQKFDRALVSLARFIKRSKTSRPALPSS